MLSQHKLMSTTLRGYTGLSNHVINLNYQYIKQVYKPLIAPHLLTYDCKYENLKLIQRARADSVGLRFQLSNTVIAKKYFPESNEPLKVMLYDWFEQLRVEAICPDDFKGSKHNLQRQFYYWTEHSYLSGTIENHTLLLLFTLTQMLYSHLNNIPIYEPDEGALEETRGGISPIIGHELYGMKKTKYNQEKYAQHSIAIIEKINFLIKDESVKNKNNNPKASQILNRWLQSSINDSSGIETSKEKTVSQVAQYSVYTKDFDTELPIEKLIRKSLLSKLYSLHQDSKDQIDFKSININWLSQQLKKAFQYKVTKLDDDFDNGYTNGSKLVPLILSQKDLKPFLNQSYQIKSKGFICLLLDCSGSMRKYNFWVINWLITLIRSCERSDIKIEILAYTTNAWNGGRALKQWQNDTETTQKPGRLNEINHIIIKQSEHKLSKSKFYLMGLLKEDIYKENIDGEAIEWACQRIYKKSVSGKKKLIIISDGNPSDTSTLQNNNEELLNNHLHQVLKKQYRKNGLNPIGVGLNVELPSCYEVQTRLSTEEKPNQKTYKELLKLLSY